MRFLTSKEVYSEASTDWHVITQLFSADTTIREVVEVTLLPLFGVTDVPESISIWDCTLHPPRDITDWPTKLYPARMGQKSKTLYGAGWFPSGVWQILPRGNAPKLLSISEDTQYNVQDKAPLSTKSTNEVRVGVSSNERMQPSQVLQSVKARFDLDPTTDETAARHAQRQNKLHQKQKQAAKHASLEARIAKLNTTKKSTTSVQVQKMLIKSRCTGLKTLKQQDRVHLHVVVVSGESTTEDYRYFSTQDTVARIVSNMSPPGAGSELLVKLNGIYKRLPVAMRLYEAIADAYVQDVDSILIRVYSRDDDEPTASVLEQNDRADDDDDVPIEVHHDSNDDMGEFKICNGALDSTASFLSDLLPPLPTAISPADLALLRSTLAKHHNDQCDNKRKPSATSTKVQQMLMKGKAKGDKKRTPKVEDRFFVNVVIVRGGDTGPYFMNTKDTFGRLLQDGFQMRNGGRLFAATGCSEFFVLPLDVTFEQAEQQGLLANFGEVIILPNE
jgi:hypothetical protein